MTDGIIIGPGMKEYQGTQVAVGKAVIDPPRSRFDQGGMYMELISEDDIMPTITPDNEATGVQQINDTFIGREFKMEDFIDDEPAPMDLDWQEFNETMVKHIKEMRKKYQMGEGVEVAQLLPVGWSLGDAFKYTMEILRYFNDPEMMTRAVPRQMALENILKAAHCLQITYSKLINTKASL